MTIGWLQNVGSGNNGLSADKKTLQSKAELTQIDILVQKRARTSYRPHDK